MKIAVIMTENLFSYIMFQAILDKGIIDNKIVGVFKSTRPFFKNKPGYLSSIVKIVKAYSVYFFAFKVFETIIYTAACHIAYLLNKIGIPSNIRIRSLASLAHEHNFPLYILEEINSDVNSREILQMIKGMEPDVIISISANQRLGRELISIPKTACINVHVASLPRYRGVCPYFWVVYNQEKETGVTVHYVDEDFDTGLIIHQKKIAIDDEDSVQSVFLKGSIEGKKLLSQALIDIANGQARAEKQVAGSTYYSWPKPNDYRLFKRRRKNLWSLKEYLQAFTLKDI